MKASTLFALTLALLLGLGAAAGARYAGLFDKKPTPPPEAPRPIPKVLVANSTLFEDVTITADMVRLRDLTPEEIPHYEANKDKYMPALQMAAHLRTPLRTIPANIPLMKDYFKEAGLPDPLSARISPGYRAVHTTVQKDKAAGGVIQVGEFVDVFLTAKICTTPECKSTMTKTACIAKGCKVVMKRGSLFITMSKDPDGKPLHYTLEVNPYRAALIEYAQNVGTLALIPVQASAKKGPPFAEPTSKEYADEDVRVEKMNSGELTIGAADLYRIFNLTPATPPPAPTIVRHIEGTKPIGQSVFPNLAAGTASTPSGSGVSTAAGTGTAGSGTAGASGAMGGLQPAGNFTFMPAASEEAGCKDCAAKKAQREAQQNAIR